MFYSLYLYKLFFQISTDCDQVIETIHNRKSYKPPLDAVHAIHHPSDTVIRFFLCVANETSNRSIVRVGVSTSKSQCRVPGISSRGIPRPKSHNLSLSSGSSILSSLVGPTDIGQLIVDAVGDDGWVESLLLSLVDERVDGLEGRCG